MVTCRVGEWAQDGGNKIWGTRDCPEENFYIDLTFEICKIFAYSNNKIKLKIWSKLTLRLNIDGNRWISVCIKLIILLPRGKKGIQVAFKHNSLTIYS